MVSQMGSQGHQSVQTRFNKSRVFLLIRNSVCTQGLQKREFIKYMTELHLQIYIHEFALSCRPTKRAPFLHKTSGIFKFVFHFTRNWHFFVDLSCFLLNVLQVQSSLFTLDFQRPLSWSKKTKSVVTSWNDCWASSVFSSSNMVSGWTVWSPFKTSDNSGSILSSHSLKNAMICSQ